MRVSMIAQSVDRLATDWTVWGSNPVGAEVFLTRPNRPWGPPTLLYNRYRVCLGGRESGQGLTLTTHPNLAPRLKKQ
jgi:hypothetical protein